MGYGEYGTANAGGSVPCSVDVRIRTCNCYCILIRMASWVTRN